MIHLEAVAYEHAAALIGRTPAHVSRNFQLLADAHTQCYRRYRTRGQVIGIDVYNLEAEAMGARIAADGSDGVPVIATPPCTRPDEIRDLTLRLDSRSLTQTLKAADQFAADNPAAQVGIPVAGPFSVASALVGMVPLLCAMADDAEAIRALLLRLTDTLRPWHQAVCASGHRPVVFESGVAPPLLSPALFRDTAAPALARMLPFLHDHAAQPPSLIIGGNTLAIADDLATLPVASVIAPRETDRAAFLERWKQRPDVHIRVNMDARVFAQNDWNRIENEWLLTAAIAASRANTSVGTGVLPYHTPPTLVENLVTLAEPAHDSPAPL